MMGVFYNTDPTESLQKPYRTPTIIASFVTIRSKAVVDTGNRFDIARSGFIWLNRFSEERDRTGNTLIIAPLHPPGLFTNLLGSQHDFRVTHEVQ